MTYETLRTWTCDRCGMIAKRTGEEDGWPEKWAGVKLDKMYGRKEVSAVVCQSCLIAMHTAWGAGKREVAAG